MVVDKGKINKKIWESHIFSSWSYLSNAKIFFDHGALFSSILGLTVYIFFFIDPYFKNFFNYCIWQSPLNSFSSVAGSFSSLSFCCPFGQLDNVLLCLTLSCVWGSAYIWRIYSLLFQSFQSNSNLPSSAFIFFIIMVIYFV